MLYSPLLTLMEVGVFVPVMVTRFDSRVFESVTDDCGSNANALGVTSVPDSVVEVNAWPAPPTVMTVWVSTPWVAADTCRTRTICPRKIVAAAFVNAAPSMLYSPLDTEIGTASVTPEIRTGADVTVLESATPDCAGNAKASGVVSVSFDNIGSNRLT